MERKGTTLVLSEVLGSVSALRGDVACDLYPAIKAAPAGKLNTLCTGTFCDRDRTRGILSEEPRVSHICTRAGLFGDMLKNVLVPCGVFSFVLFWQCRVEPRAEHILSMCSATELLPNLCITTLMQKWSHFYVTTTFALKSMTVWGYGSPSRNGYRFFPMACLFLLDMTSPEIYMLLICPLALFCPATSIGPMVQAGLSGLLGYSLGGDLWPSGF